MAWLTELVPERRCGAKGEVSLTTVQRLVDLFGSSILLLAAAPFFLITALAIWSVDHGPVFYRQTRAGLFGRPFSLLKFRSMQVNSEPLDDDTEIREGHCLVTPVGRWIRRFKVDELPQLLNVLLGHMALIGPRPTVLEQVEKYTAYEHQRLHIPPGMTGWAQVNGGIELTWPERIMLDVWYTDHRSFWLDVRILWLTVAVILFGDQRNPKVLQEAMEYASQRRGVTGLDLPTLPVSSIGPVGGDTRDATAPEATLDSLFWGGSQRRESPTSGAVKAQIATSGTNTAQRCRVVHLTSVHHAFDVRIFHKECKSLAMAGYDVTLIAPRTEGDVIRDGVKVCAVRPPRNRRERMTRTIWSVYEAAVRENAAIYHFHDPELMPVGFLLRMGGKHVIYDVHEDYSNDVRQKQWIPALLRGPASGAVRTCEVTFTATFDRVIAATPTIAQKFRVGQTRLVQNFPWTHEFSGSDNPPYEKREALAVYVGGLSDDRGLREMRQAVELAAKETPVRLVTAGQVALGAKAEFESDRESRLVEHKGLLSRSKVAELLARARVGLVLLHPTVNYLNAQPNKLFEYMSAGLPVIASNFPLWRKVVRSAECGLVVDPLNPQAIADALVWVLRHPAHAAEMGMNGRRIVAEKYNWEHEAEGLIAAYAELQPA